MLMIVVVVVVVVSIGGSAFLEATLFDTRNELVCLVEDASGLLATGSTLFELAMVAERALFTKEMAASEVASNVQSVRKSNAVST
jgi:hypothetical protein